MVRLLMLVLLALAPPAVAARAEPPPAPHRGGTLRLVAHAGAGSIDPQVNDTAQYWQIYAVSYDGLLTYRKAEDADGLVLVPDLADPRDLFGLLARGAAHVPPESASVLAPVAA